MRESVDRIIRGLFGSRLEKGEKGRQRERERNGSGEKRRRSRVPKGFGRACHVPLSRDSRRGRSARCIIVAHEDRDGGCLLSTACHISIPADFSNPRAARHGMLDNYSPRGRTPLLHERIGNTLAVGCIRSDSPDRFESLSDRHLSAPPLKETDLFPPDFRFQPEYFLLYRGRSRSIHFSKETRSL